MYAWLRPTDPSTNYNKALDLRHLGSGQWLLNSDAYKSWQTCPNSFLWLNGKAGCGKTIISSTIIEDLRDKISDSHHHILLYFYFDFSNPTKQQYESMLRSLISQIYNSQPAIQSPLQALYTSMDMGKTQPEITLLKRTFYKMIGLTENVWMVLDALDECSDQVRGLFEFIETIHTTHNNTSFIVTSRLEHDIHSKITKWASQDDLISLRSNLIDEDISNYIKNMVYSHESLSQWAGYPDVQEEIQSVLTSKADGMYEY